MNRTVLPKVNSRASLIGRMGFTLVELLISFAILALVITIVYQFFNFSGNMYKKTDDLAAQQDQARLIVLGLRKEIGTAIDAKIISAQDPSNYDVPAGSLAVFDREGRLAQMDSSGSDSIKYVFSSVPVNLLDIEFSSSEENVLHVAISVDTTLIAETDIYIQNMEGSTEPLTKLYNKGNMVLYIPSY